jgi:hypothetical protein
MRSDLGVTAVIECVNRSESYLANSLETARRLVEAAGSGHVMVMADSFHMNIEKVDIAAALESVASWLRHVHLADNNRMAPGMGHFDLEAFFATLIRIGYQGPITMECDVQVLDQFARYAPSTSSAAFDSYAATAIKTLRGIEARLASWHLSPGAIKDFGPRIDPRMKRRRGSQRRSLGRLGAARRAGTSMDQQMVAKLASAHERLIAALSKQPDGKVNGKEAKQ